jgi:hypothetical protein
MRSFYLSSLLTLFIFTAVSAQDADPGPGAVTVFSEDGENFTLFLNGEKANASPATRVVVANVKEVPVSFRIVFENSTSPEIKKNGIRQGRNCLYSVAKNKKGERVLKMKGCSEEGEASVAVDEPAPQPSSTESVATTTPEQLSATYSNGVISINDGRTLTVKKVKANGMTYPRLIMTALTGAKVSIAYDGNDEKYSAETPLQYEVKDFSNNNAYFTLTVDEGGPKKTWKVKLQNANGYDLKIE